MKAKGQPSQRPVHGDRGLAPQGLHLLDAHVVLADMHSRRARQLGQVGTVVDNEANAILASHGNDGVQGFQKRPRADVFGAKLQQRGSALEEMQRHWDGKKSRLLCRLEIDDGVEPLDAHRTH